MSEPVILKKPWTNIAHGLPPEDLSVVWMDVDGGNHLARYKEGAVWPIVYDEQDVRRHLDWHVCWRLVPEATNNTSKTLPDDGQEVLWFDDEGCPLLGVRRGKSVSVIVYGHAKEISRSIAHFDFWQAIDEPQIKGADQGAVEV